MKIHFIAIGGSAMHNLAIALKIKGYTVSGSDDEIFEPSKTRLKKYGLLPNKIGWDTSIITNNIDAIILGMHARKDNPQLIKAKELGIKIYSYPEYLYSQSINKKRIVIGGSHGKTTITSMILHVLNYYQIENDYMVGAQLDGFEVMVKLSDAPIIILEGDEYLSSPIDMRPKFIHYKPDIAVISGIAWDHINVFPTFENYKEQFKNFADSISKDGCLIYAKDDDNVVKIAEATNNIKKIPYSAIQYNVSDNLSYAKFDKKEYPLSIFGYHNMCNLNAALKVCNELGVSDMNFYAAIQSFKGASKRLEPIAQNTDTIVFKDFAHAPSKLKASVNAVKEQYHDKLLIACLELHTFSSLNKKFLSQYKNTMDKADVAIVYFNPHVLEHKKLEPLSKTDVKNAFNREDIIVLNSSEEIAKTLINSKSNKNAFLLMSSGNFDGINFNKLANQLL